MRAGEDSVAVRLWFLAENAPWFLPMDSGSQTKSIPTSATDLAPSGKTFVQSTGRLSQPSFKCVGITVVGRAKRAVDNGVRHFFNGAY
jgi:hypothetical protein